MEDLKKNVFGMFQDNEMSYEDAQKKVKEESGSSTQYFQMKTDGVYAVRILPLAPVIDMDGNPLPLERKGYEYPSRSLWLNINTGKTDNKGKEKTLSVKVNHVKQVHPDVPSDLIDKYVELVCSKHSNDEELCKKVKSNSFSGGLKWGYERNMYILDCTDDKSRAQGPQLLALSFSQYKTLEELKMNTWNKLNKNGRVPCPISSIQSAFMVEITRKTENKKVSYSLSVDTLSGQNSLTEKELETLIDTPRLPEVLYKYNRRQLEATVVFLKQYDQALDIDVMSDPAIQECIDQIKLALPADDNSKFDMNGASVEEGAASGAKTIDQLWDAYDDLVKQDLEDFSEEGQEIRDDIRDFIETNNLNIRVDRRKTIQDLLTEIEDTLAEAAPLQHEDTKENTTTVQEPEPEPEPQPEPEPEPEPARSRRNDDTNEPAARPSRRSARPERRR